MPTGISAGVTYNLVSNGGSLAEGLGDLNGGEPLALDPLDDGYAVKVDNGFLCLVKKLVNKLGHDSLCEISLLPGPLHLILGQAPFLRDVGQDAGSFRGGLGLPGLVVSSHYFRLIRFGLVADARNSALGNSAGEGCPYTI